MKKSWSRKLSMLTALGMIVTAAGQAPGMAMPVYAETEAETLAAESTEAHTEAKTTEAAEPHTESRTIETAGPETQATEQTAAAHTEGETTESAAAHTDGQAAGPGAGGLYLPGMGRARGQQPDGRFCFRKWYDRQFL